MICAYTIEELKARRNRSLAEKWEKSGILSEGEKKSIFERYPDKLYHPNFAFQVLFFLGALVSVSGLIGIILIPMIEMMDDAPSGLLFFFGGLLLFLNELFFLYNKRHFRSGLLQGIYYMAVSFILIGIGFLIEDVNAVFYFGAFLLFALLAIRYLDRVAVILAFFMFYACILILFENMMFALPFLLAFLNAGIFILFYYLREEEILYKWKEVIQVLLNNSLIMAALSLNVFIVQEGASEFLNLYGELPYKWLFVLFSVLIPAAYLYVGIAKRKRIFLRVGMVTMALGLAGIKYYYSSGHTEFTLTFTGLLVFSMSIYFIRKYKNVINGLTSKKVEGKGSALLTVLMAVHAERDVQISSDTGTEMGGGSFGGGGAGDNF